MKGQRGGGKQEPTLDLFGGREAAAARQNEQLAALCADVFRLTGKKVTEEDPILLAALFQSELVRRAGEQAAAALREAATETAAQLNSAASAAREQAASLDRAVASAFERLADGARQLGEQEHTALQTRFARTAADTLERVRREAARQAPGGRWWRWAAALSAGLALGLLTALALGAADAPALSDEQARLLHNGMLLDAAWNKLPPSARSAFGVEPQQPPAAGGKNPPRKP